MLLETTARVPRVIVANKADLDAAWNDEDVAAEAVLRVSALTGDGLDALARGDRSRRCARRRARTAISPAVTNLRHVDLLTRARRGARPRGIGGARRGPEEFVLADINEARGLLEEITGARTPDDVLAQIFSQFLYWQIVVRSGLLQRHSTSS